MPAPALQLVPPDSGSPGAWPWIVLLAAGGTLALALGERLSHIPRSLERAAQVHVASAGAPDVTVDVDGRDVTLLGEIAASGERRALIASVAAIDGVRVVVDELVVVDPVSRAQAERTRFRDALAAIDVASVTFEPGSSSIASGSEDALAAVARLMLDMPAYRVRVAGHTDSRGRAAINLALSRERAAAVATELTDRGVEPARIIAQGYGSTRPVADNGSEAGRARNRRIEIVNID